MRSRATPAACSTRWPRPGTTLATLAGPELVGSQGYGCISCHVWNGRQLAPADPGAVGPDLTKAAVDQLIPGWVKPAGRPGKLSLTLVDVAAERFSVALIPHTLAATTLGFKQPGSAVNLETDLLAKYVWKCLQHFQA